MQWKTTHIYMYNYGNVILCRCYHDNSQFYVRYVSEWAMMMGIARQHCFVIVTPVNQMHIDHHTICIYNLRILDKTAKHFADASAQTQPKWVIVRKIHMQNVLNKALYKFKQQKQTIDIWNGMKSHTNTVNTYTEKEKERKSEREREKWHVLNESMWPKAVRMGYFFPAYV